MASVIDAQVTSDTEKTFQYQDKLASLPAPNLEHTLKKYLDSVKPHVTAEELRQTEFLCQQFASGEGKLLDEKLQAMAKSKRNWLERWWEDCAYMEGRLPNPLMNMAGPGPYMYDVWKPEVGSMIPRTALMLHFTMLFWQMVRREQVRPHRDAKGRPLCMDQFRKLFSTCKIPGVQQDHLVHYFKTEAEGPAPSHVVVLCKGRVWSLQCVDEGGEVLSAPELQSQLQVIHDQATRLPATTGLGFFTALERTQWAQVRSRLLTVHPDNFHSLEAIQQAVVAIGLDDHSPKDVDDLTLHGLFGDPNSKWFDKSMNFVAYKNGMFISNCDHSPMDGMMLVFSTYYVHCKLMECDGKWKGPTGVRKLPQPELHDFHLDADLTQSLRDAQAHFKTLSGRVSLKVSRFQDYGKRYLKVQRVHPDTTVQLALQLGYYRCYNKPAPTYETATTRQFYHARTETVRSCTSESLTWCRSMTSNTATGSERRRLFKAAVDKQNKSMEESSNLQGCDRHLFGLAMVAREEGRPLAPIFMDPSFVKSGGGGHFKLSTSCIGYTTVFGSVAPMCPDGYGVFYCIHDDQVIFVTTTWTADRDTCSARLTGAVHRALADIRLLLDSPGTSSTSTARL